MDVEGRRSCMLNRFFILASHGPVFSGITNNKLFILRTLSALHIHSLFLLVRTREQKEIERQPLKDRMPESRMDPLF